MRYQTEDKGAKGGGSGSCCRPGQIDRRTVFQEVRAERGLTTADLLGPGGNVKCVLICVRGVKCRKELGQVKLKFQSH